MQATFRCEYIHLLLYPLFVPITLPGPVSYTHLKYRYNKLALGDINGIPRVLDAGQCNDSYSLAVIALKLKEIFGLDDVNQLPIVYNIAWYEQKAVIVLLALLALGVKHIHLERCIRDRSMITPNLYRTLPLWKMR